MVSCPYPKEIRKYPINRYESPIIEEFWHFSDLVLSDSWKCLQIKIKALILLMALKHGATGENRTHDLTLTKGALYH